MVSNFTDHTNLLEDEYVKRYFLMSTPLWPVSIIATYLLAIFVIIPKIMEDRKPLNIKIIMRIYNIVQIALNISMVLMCLRYFDQFCIYCNILSKSGESSAFFSNLRIYHLFFLMKIIDLTDTIFHALRKRTKQISPLHLHHHISMVLGTWYYIYTNPRLFAVYMAFINSLVHAIMYFYYLLTSCTEALRHVTWIKRSVTQIQILQHYSIFFVYAVLFLRGYLCVTTPNMVALLLNLAIVIAFFTHFYITSYVKKKTT